VVKIVEFLLKTENNRLNARHPKLWGKNNCAIAARASEGLKHNNLKRGWGRRCAWHQNHKEL